MISWLITLFLLHFIFANLHELTGLFSSGKTLSVVSKPAKSPKVKKQKPVLIASPYWPKRTLEMDKMNVQFHLPTRLN